MRVHFLGLLLALLPGCPPDDGPKGPEGDGPIKYTEPAGEPAATPPVDAGADGPIG